jgi:hypothetical protein
LQCIILTAHAGSSSIEEAQWRSSDRKKAYRERAAREMKKHLLTPEWNVRQKIALSCRILADEGHESALAGQITARGEKPGTYWMLSFGLASTRHRRGTSCCATTI